MTDPYSVQLRRDAKAFRYYGASAEAQECEDLAVKFEEYEDEIKRLKLELEWLGRKSLMSRGMEP